MTFLDNAQELLELGSGSDCRSTVTLCVNAAIAFGDALTLSRLREVNTGDHTRLTTLLRRALGNQLTSAAERDLRNLLGQKQDASYGHRILKREDAERALERALRLRRFAESLLRS